MSEAHRAMRRGRTKGSTVDAWASGGEEGRSELRKAAGSRTQAVSRGYPNGATSAISAADGGAECIGAPEPTRGSETSQYPQEKKANAIP